MKIRRIQVVVIAVLLSAGPCGLAAETDASPPKSVTLSVYDTGFALVNELRSAQLDKGENGVRFLQLPARLDPSTVALSFLAGGASVDVLDQKFQYDLGSVGRMFDRFAGKPVEINSGAGLKKGILLSAPGANSPLAIRGEDGSVEVFSNPGALTGVVFPNADQLASLDPTLLCRMTAAQDSLQNLRLTYAAEGIRWDATYDAILPENGSECFMVARANLSNDSGGRFENARVRLVSTEKGSIPSGMGRDVSEGGPALRYSYGQEETAFEKSVASAGSLNTYELPRPLTIEPGAVLHVQICMADKVPATKFYVYDGVRFDRYQRNRRNDWNFGTEFHTTVQTHLQFSNTKTTGLGLDLPQGRFRLYRQRNDGSLDLLGDDRLQATPAESTASVLLGPARGIRGERERTGYSEVTPLHEYEESFEIRLENNSTEEVEIRVVEHLYRGNQFEVVKADTDYKAMGPQTIEFRPVLKPGGKRSVHYTVRYRW